MIRGYHLSIPPPNENIGNNLGINRDLGMIKADNTYWRLLNDLYLHSGEESEGKEFMKAAMVIGADIRDRPLGAATQATEGNYGFFRHCSRFPAADSLRDG